MRVAVDANCLAWGWSGIPKYVDRVVRELARSGVEIDLLANTSRAFTDIEGVRQVHRRVKGTALWRHVVLLPWLVRSRPDVLWAPEAITPIWSPVPSAVTVHDLATVMFPSIKSARERRLHATTVRRSVRQAGRVMAVSEVTARELSTRWGVATDVVRIVPNGVDEQFTPGDREEALRFAEERRGLRRPFVLSVGTLEPRKGLDVLAATASLAVARDAELEFVVVGRLGFRGDELARALVASGARILSDVEDDELVQLSRAAEVLAAPSLYEGFGVTPLEAMASGTPAVVSANAGALEATAGPAAVVVRERTPEAWLAAIEDARSRRAELVERGRVHAADYRWRDVAARVGEVLEEAARTGPKDSGRGTAGAP
jgi:glycosyltransferase involved in cell wall biosynthesis